MKFFNNNNEYRATLPYIYLVCYEDIPCIIYVVMTKFILDFGGFKT